MKIHRNWVENLCLRRNIFMKTRENFRSYFKGALKSIFLNGKLKKSRNKYCLGELSLLTYVSSIAPSSLIGSGGLVQQSCVEHIGSMVSMSGKARGELKVITGYNKESYHTQCLFHPIAKKNALKKVGYANTFTHMSI